MVIICSFPFSFLLLNFPFHEDKSASRCGKNTLKQAEDHKVVAFLSCPVLCCPFDPFALVFRLDHLWILLSSTVQNRVCDWSLGTASVLPWWVVWDEKSTIHAFSVWDLFICMTSRPLWESSPLGDCWQSKTNQIKAKLGRFSYTKSCSKTKLHFCGALSWLCVSPVKRQRRAGRKSQLLSKCPNLIYLLLPSPTQTVLLTC